MKVLVTGANGFIGKNLCLGLKERSDITVLPITRESSQNDLNEALSQCDFVFHLAGINRPKTESEFYLGNTAFTQMLCAALDQDGRAIPIVFSSSIQAETENPYGISKLEAENIILEYGQTTGAKTYIFRLPNVFGKWCKPNYNSAVATFCHNIPRGIQIAINDPAAKVNLVYIDDVINLFLARLNEDYPSGFQKVEQVYSSTVGEIADMIQSFEESRETLITENVGTGLTRALYATYVSSLPTELFAYKVPMHIDARGTFVEMLKTHDSGQFSFFTAHPGITRGDHYHHTKTEKFLVIKGTGKFGFRNLDTGEEYELIAKGEESQIVETIPGWTHNITNIGDVEMVVMLWANEIFDRDRPDTITQKV